MFYDFESVSYIMWADAEISQVHYEDAVTSSAPLQRDVADSERIQCM